MSRRPDDRDVSSVLNNPYRPRLVEQGEAVNKSLNAETASIDLANDRERADPNGSTSSLSRRSRRSLSGSSVRRNKNGFGGPYVVGGGGDGDGGGAASSAWSRLVASANDARVGDSVGGDDARDSSRSIETRVRAERVRNGGSMDHDLADDGDVGLRSAARRAPLRLVVGERDALGENAVGATRTLGTTPTRNPRRARLLDRIASRRPTLVDDRTEAEHHVADMDVDDADDDARANEIADFEHGSLHRPPYDDARFSGAVGDDDVMDVDAPPPPPLLVVDGANVAHTYADVMSTAPQDAFSRRTTEPDARGVRLVVDHFAALEKDGRRLRVLVVLPSRWMRRKPRFADDDRNAAMQTDRTDALVELKARGYLCLCPPTDDDDAYILDIARSQRDRGGGYVLSCDLFRDAIHRRHDDGDDFRKWIREVRIPYTFYRQRISNVNGDSGDYDDEGVFVPNPSHPFIRSLNKVN